LAKKVREALSELEELKKRLGTEGIETKVKVPVKKVKPVKKVSKLPKLKRLKKLGEDIAGVEVQIIGHATGKVLQKYSLVAKHIPITVRIVKPKKEYTPIYDLYLPDMGDGTRILLSYIREKITSTVGIQAREVLDIKLSDIMERKYRNAAIKQIDYYIPGLDEKTKTLLANYLINDMLGLGKLELLLADDGLEEIVVNNASEPIWVYHKIYGWLKTNLKARDEKQISDYANAIGRRAERQINTLNPLMDAHLPTGERTNATLFPISTKGNTITIRKFAREPWSITDFIENNTLSVDIAAFIWTAMQYEMNMIISGGTASGKTSMLNVVSPFLPPNHRIISIEDTRELRLPSYLHWVPMVTRQPNPEGKGGVSMLQLMVNSLRMRPDRILVGEIRRHDEAQVLFEAMHTGHSVYSTLHANTADEVRRRLITPPLSISETLLESLHLVCVQFRHRKLGIRRTLELAEVIPTGEGTISMRTLFRWRAGQDIFSQVKESIRVLPEIEMFTGMTPAEVSDEMENKKTILKWLVKQNVRKIDDIGLIIGKYYVDPSSVVNAAKKNLGPEVLFK